MTLLPATVNFLARKPDVRVLRLLVPCNVHAMDPWFLACTTKLSLARAGALCVLLRLQPAKLDVKLVKLVHGVS